MFTKEKHGSEGKEIWRCEMRSCRCRIHSKGDQKVQEIGAHNHALSRGKLDVERVRSNMKLRGETTEEATRSIVDNELLTNAARSLAILTIMTLRKLDLAIFLTLRTIRRHRVASLSFDLGHIIW